MAVYTTLSLVFPAKETFLSQQEFDEQQSEFDVEVRHEDHGSVGSTEKEKSGTQTHAHPV